MARIGLLGGTFDPIHFGHLRMAEELAQSLQLDTVKFIPAATPPLKTPPQVSANHRSAMVKLGIAGNPCFALDERELTRGGPSYTVDTLRSLRSELNAHDSMVMFVGSDAFKQFNRWHQWQDIIQLCHIALVDRPNGSMPTVLNEELVAFLHRHYTENSLDLQSQTAGFITMQAITPLTISSTALREQIKQHQSARYLSPDNVLDYIDQHRLYQA
ncbi:MAG: nicotinate-nucleotide adenylyltransferase [Methylotenera sp.]|nr:nicotinate-nucleotide adenylyltransferase [Methylotenera sp.]